MMPHLCWCILFDSFFVQIRCKREKELITVTNCQNSTSKKMKWIPCNQEKKGRGGGNPFWKFVKQRQSWASLIRIHFIGLPVVVPGSPSLGLVSTLPALHSFLMRYLHIRVYVLTDAFKWPWKEVESPSASIHIASGAQYSCKPNVFLKKLL